MRNKSGKILSVTLKQVLIRIYETVLLKFNLNKFRARMNKEDLERELIGLTKKIEEFISKYDPIYTLHYVSQFQKRSENPLINFLFNLSLKNKNNIKTKASKAQLDDLIKKLETCCNNQRILMLFEKQESIILKAKSEYLKNLINPEIYLSQLFEKLNSIFYNIENLFFEEFKFYPIHIQVVSFAISYLQGKKNTPLLFKEKDILNFINQEKENFKSEKHKKGISYYLDSISSEFGTNKNYNSIFDEDISKKKPLIKINDQYFCCNFMQLQYLLPYQLGELINSKGSNLLKDKYRQSKQEYTERLSYEKFKKLFGKRNVFRNLYYIDSGKKYELDTLIYYDHKFIICETKSNRMRETSLAGDFNKLQEDLKKIIKKPFEQSERVINYISKKSDACFYNKKGDVVLKIENANNTKNLLEFFSIGIHEANLMGVANNINLSNLNYFKKKYFWAVNLLELDIILNHIEYPTLFIHYIKSRLEAQTAGIVHTSDELSFFGLFLNNPCGGFYFNDGSKFIGLQPDWVKPLDDFYTRKTDIFPEVKIDTRIKKIIEEREYLNSKRLSHGHTDVVCALLKMNKSYLDDFINNIDIRIQKTKKDKKTYDIFTTLKDDITGFGFVSDIDTQRGMQIANFFALKNKYKHKLKCVIYLFKNVNDNFVISNFLICIFPFKQNEKMDKFLLEYEKNCCPKSFKPTLNEDGSITNKPILSTDKCICNSGKQYGQCCGRFMNKN